MAVPLAAKLKKVLNDESFAVAAAGPQAVKAEQYLPRRAAREHNAQEFDAAIDEGLRAFGEGRS